MNHITHFYDKACQKCQNKLLKSIDNSAHDILLF